MNGQGRIARAGARLLAVPVHAYRYVLSPLLPPSCRYQPTCSAYALEALEVHGPLRGTALAVRRILRCHPIRFLGGGEGFDPVPPVRGACQSAVPQGNATPDPEHPAAAKRQAARGLSR